MPEPPKTDAWELEITRRSAAYDDLVELLREMEWCGRDAGGAYCPICCASIRDGHDPDCRLADALAR